MNLRDLVKFIKRFFEWSDEEVGHYFGISRPQITKINNGYWEGLSCATIKRISQVARISIDELLDNPFFPPSYHISNHVYSIYIKAPEDYPDFSICKGDFLYIRPFVHEPSKFNQLVLQQQNGGYTVIRYTDQIHPSTVHFHIVGLTRYLYAPIANIDYQKQLESSPKPPRRGAPIKL